MDLFNIGSGELLFVLLIAILVVGPRRAAELASQGGRLLARLRQEWTSVRRDIMTEIAVVEQEKQTTEKLAVVREVMGVEAETEAETGTETETEKDGGE